VDLWVSGIRIENQDHEFLGHLEDFMPTLDCWFEIRNLKGRTLKTPDRRKPFQVVEVTDHAVTVLPLETGKERPIQRAGIENAFRHLGVTGRLMLAELENEYTPRNPVYAAAMLAELPGVKYGLRPIRLRWSG
jgi:hypothetical protein